MISLGGARLGPKAAVRRDVTVIAGSLETKPTATIGGKPVVLSLGTQWLGMNWFKEWLSSGLLWARPLAPGLVWIWIWTGICLAFYLLLALIFPRPLRACVSTLENRPVAAIFSGLLAFLLIGPLMLLLVISIIGVAAIPFLTCGLIMAFVFGKIALYQFTGEQIALQTGVAGLRHPLVALIVGMAVFCLLYIIPVLGFVVWGLAAPLGLGAAVLAFAGNFRREPARLAASTASPPSEPKPPVMSAKPAAEPVPGELALNPRAGFWIRLWATLLDLLLVGVLVTLFNLNRFALLAWTVYLVVMWGWKGTTIGGSVFGLKVIRTDGRPLGFEVAVVRSLAGFLSAFPFFLGFMWAGWDKESQSWHDKIAGTLIVKMPKGVALL
ncbi:MAG: RDD family protein [Candidatus Omnitrophica bacterium]|nr:RDD family protein [Candidatus Omnitrophota bacterium]